MSDPATTALLLIDFQAGIVQLPLEPRSGAEATAAAARLADAFRSVGSPVIYVRVKLDELRAWPADLATHDPAQVPPPEASDLVPEAGFRDGDTLVTKRQWGAFAGTDLDATLSGRGVRTLVIGGITTNFGVESTARAALDLGYDLVFAEDAMTSVGTGAHEGAVHGVFPFMGHVRSVDRIIAGLRA